MICDPLSPYPSLWPTCWGYYPLPTIEETREAHKRLGQWWLERCVTQRYDRCCHGKKL